MSIKNIYVNDSCLHSEYVCIQYILSRATFHPRYFDGQKNAISYTSHSLPSYIRTGNAFFRAHSILCLRIPSTDIFIDQSYNNILRGGRIFDFPIYVRGEKYENGDPTSFTVYDIFGLTELRNPKDNVTIVYELLEVDSKEKQISSVGDIVQWIIGMIQKNSSKTQIENIDDDVASRFEMTLISEREMHQIHENATRLLLGSIEGGTPSRVKKNTIVSDQPITVERNISTTTTTTTTTTGNKRKESPIRQDDDDDNNQRTAKIQKPIEQVIDVIVPVVHQTPPPTTTTTPTPMVHKQPESIQQEDLPRAEIIVLDDTPLPSKWTDTDSNLERTPVLESSKQADSISPPPSINTPRPKTPSTSSSTKKNKFPKGLFKKRTGDDDIDE